MNSDIKNFVDPVPLLFDDRLNECGPSQLFVATFSQQRCNRSMLKLAPRIRIQDFTYDDGSPRVLGCGTIQAYPHDWYDPTIPKLCADPFHDV